MHRLYFLIGASGAGKTTASRELEKRRSDIQFCFPDKEQRVPSEEERIRDFGSSSNWQKVKTGEWVKNTKEKYLEEKPALIDTQSRYEFIRDACAENGISDFQVILFDCEDLVRSERVHTRGQPHLANPKMNDWARFLREDCKQNGCIIVDTSHLSLEDMTDELEKSIR